MRILGFIPARSGSKGVPGKNIKSLAGKPLLHYTTEIALQSNLLSEVIVSTDGEEIAAVAKLGGARIPFLRPSHLAQDDTPTIAVLQHALKWYAEQGLFFDAVCLLQVTSPFRTVDFLNSAIQKFINSECDSLISVRKVPTEFNPHWVFEKTTEGRLKIATGERQIIPRRQELPDAFHRDGSIYLTKSDVIVKQQSLFGESTAYIESPDGFYANIDTAADWLAAENLALRLQKNR